MANKIIDNSLLRSEIPRLNLNLDKIAKHIGVFDAVTKEINEELKSLIVEGKRIKAIKRYRMVTRLGLKESKEYIDSLINNDTIRKKFRFKLFHIDLKLNFSVIAKALEFACSRILS